MIWAAVTAYIGSGPFDQPIAGMEPVTWIVASAVISGCGFMLLPASVTFLQSRNGSLYWVLGIGLAARLLMMVPDPILEIDFYRYLWDGAVINAGYSPYQWTPGQVMSGAVPEDLVQLSQGANGIIELINYPQLTSIYPPVAELVFAIANWIEPWNLMVLRLLILLFDIATVILLLRLMKQLNRAPLWIIVYWWNPVVIFEFGNAAHMDAILLPFLLGALLFASNSRTLIVSTISLAISTSIKLWPVLLLPTFIRNINRPRTALIMCFLFLAVSAALLWPLVTQLLRLDSGLRAYGLSWERNAALFHTLHQGLQATLDRYGLFDLDTGRLLRVCTGAAMVFIALGINYHAPKNQEKIARRIIIVIAALLLLGPTMYPWYYTWMVPFLAIVPSPALLALSVVLPLYRLQYHPWFLDNIGAFTDIVVWLEQGPIFLLLLLEWRSDATSSTETPV